MPESSELQQETAAAAEKAAELALWIRELEEHVTREQEAGNSLTAQAQVVQQQVTALDKALCSQCLHAAEYVHLPAAVIMSSLSNSCDGGSSRSSSGTLSLSSSRNVSFSRSLSFGSSSGCGSICETSNWFTKATGSCDQRDVEALQQEIAALNLQVANGEGEAAELQADILSRTDARIFAESDMRDNLTSEIASLQGQLQDAKEIVEDQLNDITDLRFDLVTTKRTSANRRASVERLLLLLEQTLTSVGKMGVQL